MPQDYYSNLVNLVRSSAPDDAQKRRAIYALARSGLRQFLAREKLHGPPRTQELQALEAAVERIESEFARPSERALTVVAPSIEILPPEDPRPNRTKLQHEPTTHPRPTRYGLLSLVAAAIMAIITYLTVERGLRDDAPETIGTSSNVVDAGQPLAQHVSTTEIPIPTTYGVYALNDKHLLELRPLSTKILSRSVSISLTIDTTSMAKLPNGRTQFVVFRRDMANNAPEKVQVRRLAHTVQASREPGALDEGHIWTISDTSYEMKVSPIDGNPAMILIRPAAANLTFAVGRYALVIRSGAYVFSVEGAASVGAQ
jgi:hypothetical protein